jgi:hypothetical protein
MRLWEAVRFSKEAWRERTLVCRTLRSKAPRRPRRTVISSMALVEDVAGGGEVVATETGLEIAVVCAGLERTEVFDRRRREGAAEVAGGGDWMPMGLLVGVDILAELEERRRRR